MHIPSATPYQILSFPEALKTSETSTEYDTNKWLYVPSFYTEYRYILGTKGTNPLICIGINPSTAKPDDLDNTLKSVQRIAQANSFDSFVMFNVFPQRATNPDDMSPEANEELHKANLEAFRYILSQTDNPVVWAAWGTVIDKRGYLSSCMKDLVNIGKEYNARWVSAGKISKAGHPHHPLYLKKDEKIKDFDIDTYVNSII